MQTSILNKKSLPTKGWLQKIARASNLVVVYDEKLLEIPRVADWLGLFSNSLGVEAGESLKDVDKFPSLVRKLLPMLDGRPRNQCAIVAIGGGSVGDAAGFLASVIKRGVGFIQIPSTWLAAIDSAYGGKTALNVDQHKNQIGTFYPARAVCCVADLLNSQSDENLFSGYGEAQKMALIAGGKLFQKMNVARGLDAVLLWELLPDLARAKMRVVKGDPLEKSGKRFVLNLGHTLGHAIELWSSEYDGSRLSHGAAVRVGLDFAVRFSHKKRIMSASETKRALAFLEKFPTPEFSKIYRAELVRAIASDKKAAGGGQINFVFLKMPGQPIVKRVRVNEIVDFADSLGWVRR